MDRLYRHDPAGMNVQVVMAYKSGNKLDRTLFKHLIEQHRAQFSDDNRAVTFWLSSHELNNSRAKAKKFGYWWAILPS